MPTDTVTTIVTTIATTIATTTATTIMTTMILPIGTGILGKMEIIGERRMSGMRPIMNGGSTTTMEM
jgi:hypothetical protein